jgi:putative methyltransferase (TIGR04325 family)
MSIKFSIWEGIYKSFKEVPVKGKGYDDKVWINSLLDKYYKYINDSDDGIKYNLRNSLLLLLIKEMFDKSNKFIVLDFGGGLGLSYLNIKNNLICNYKIEYHVVEKQNVCKVAKIIYLKDKNIIYHNSLPLKIKPNIIFLGSSLQYIEEWQMLINRLCKYSPEYILLEDVPAGEIKTFAAIQNYYDSRIPYWFFNKNDIITNIKQNNYYLIYESFYKSNILKSMNQYPMDNYPDRFRIKYSCNLLFVKGKR